MNLVVENVVGGDLSHAVAVETGNHAEAIRQYEEARSRFVGCGYREEALECERARLLAYLIEQEMESGMAYTPAEKKARVHPDYLAHLKLQREVVRDKEHARTHSTVALHSADLALARMKALAGLR